MINLIEEIQKAKKVEEKVKKLQTYTEIIKTKVWKILESRYKLLLDKSFSQEYSWNPNEFNTEIQLNFRSMLKRDLVLKIPRKGGHDDLNLTSQYGLKYPRTWSGTNILPFRNESTPTFKKDKFIDGEYLELDFSVLRDSEYIDFKKLKKFFYFIKKILKLYSLRKEIEEEFKKHFRTSEGYDKIESLESYSDLNLFIDFLKVEPVLKKFYRHYVKRLQDYKNQTNKILKEFQVFNKPFRVFLELKTE